MNILLLVIATVSDYIDLQILGFSTISQLLELKKEKTFGWTGFVCYIKSK